MSNLDGKDWGVREAAERGDAVAQYNLGAKYANGHGVEKNEREAVAWYRKAAEQGHAGAQNNLGAMYAEGRGIEKNEREAVAWFRSAAEQGYAGAQYNLGVRYANGRGVEKNEREAVAWFRKAAEQGFAEAQNNLGAMYEKGRGIEKNEPKAAAWFREAAKQGDASAQTNLGAMYADGRGVEKNEREAVAWFRKAAEQGSANGYFNLGVTYAHGHGVEKDEREGVAWYRKAVEQDYAPAQYNLGRMYVDGRGVEKNEHEAVACYRKAAEQGYAVAQYNLGVMYLDGRAVERDEREAMRLFKLAADQGEPLAQAALTGRGWWRNQLERWTQHRQEERRPEQEAAARERQRQQQQQEEQKRRREAADQGELFSHAAVTPGAAVIERPGTMVAQAQSSRASAGYIYILKPRISIDGQEVVKIGMTTRTVAERVRELTTGSMVSFEVVYSLHVENARRFEKYLHARYRARRLIAGGGQEFFAVPAQEVVAEVERMATEISRARAQAARNGEMAAFLTQLGAARVESRVSGRLGWLWFACWLVGTFGVNRVAHSIVSDSAVWWLTVLAALIVLPVILSIAYERLKRHFMALYYEPRFRSAIDAKHQELRLKYPLAYT